MTDDGMKSPQDDDTCLVLRFDSEDVLHDDPAVSIRLPDGTVWWKGWPGAPFPPLSSWPRGAVVVIDSVISDTPHGEVAFAVGVANPALPHPSHDTEHHAGLPYSSLLEQHRRFAEAIVDAANLAFAHDTICPFCAGYVERDPPHRRDCVFHDALRVLASLANHNDEDEP